MSDLKKLVSEKASYSSAENQKLGGFSHDDTKRLERVVWRKLDLFILPVVAMFYLLSFLVSHFFGRSCRGRLCVDICPRIGQNQLWECEGRRFTKRFENDEQTV